MATTLPAGGNSTGGDRQPGTSAETAATMLIPEVANPLTARMVKGVNTTMDEGQTMIGRAPVAFNSAEDPISGDVPGALKGYRVQAQAVAIPFDTTQITHPENRSNPQPGDPAGTMPKSGHAPAIAFHHLMGAKAGGMGIEEEVAGTVGTKVGGGAVLRQWQVRRLTPRECARLQGFPDDYLPEVKYRGKAPADGPMYKAFGNSMPRNVMEIIGERIAIVDAIE